MAEAYQNDLPCRVPASLGTTLFFIETNLRPLGGDNFPKKGGVTF